MTMEERRTLQRFDLKAPTKIKVDQDAGQKDILSLITKDISSAGAFIVTSRPLPEGVPVELEVVLPIKTLEAFIGEKGKVVVKVKGKVVRRDETGMAIAFGNSYEIKPQ